MKKRIIDSLGMDTFRLLGKIDSSWIAVNPANMEKVRKCFFVESSSESSGIVRIDTNLLKQTKFEHLEGVVFTAKNNEKSFDVQQLIKGVELKVEREGSNTIVLQIDFKDYTHPNFCYSEYLPIWYVPLHLQP